MAIREVANLLATIWFMIRTTCEADDIETWTWSQAPATIQEAGVRGGETIQKLVDRRDVTKAGQGAEVGIGGRKIRIGMGDSISLLVFSC